MPLVVALKQQNVDKLHGIVEAVSNPKSPQYGEYLDVDALSRLLAPPLQQSKKVCSHLQLHNASCTLMPSGDFLAVQATVEQVEKAFEAKVSKARQDGSDEFVLFCEECRFPSEVASLVDFVVGFKVQTNSLGTRFHSGNEAISPSEVLSALGMAVSDLGSGLTSQGVLGALGQTVTQADVNTFANRHGVRSTTIEYVGDGPKSVRSKQEAALDAEWIGVTGLPATSFMSIKSTGTTAFINYVVWAANNDSPDVHSLSYSETEYDNCDPTDKSNHCDRVDVELGKLAARGKTIVASSGDAGTGCWGSLMTGKCVHFSANFVASSRYVTAVGGTQGQSAASLSGGGFSQYTARPSWQEQHVSSYISSVELPDASWWNWTGTTGIAGESGRGVPDLAAPCKNYPVVIGGVNYLADGTSASAPVVAGMLASLNDVRVAAGQPKLGFVNPLLYQHPEAFVDITSGSNPGHGDSSCGMSATCPGFAASRGWDPVTGLGIPQFDKLKQVALSVSSTIV
jgi:tripeptidyl-peptidase-1